MSTHTTNTRTTQPAVRAATIPCPSCERVNRVDLDRAADGPSCGSCRAPIALDRPLVASDATLEQVLRDAPVPVIVDFYADWCMPCRMMAPTFAELARRRAGEALVIKVDTDRNPATAARLGIRGIPTLVAFRNGREVAREVGVVPLARLEAMLDGTLRR
jgi:thioredoxin 2